MIRGLVDRPCHRLYFAIILSSQALARAPSLDDLGILGSTRVRPPRPQHCIAHTTLGFRSLTMGHASSYLSTVADQIVDGTKTTTLSTIIVHLSFFVSCNFSIQPLTAFLRYACTDNKHAQIGQCKNPPSIHEGLTDQATTAAGAVSVCNFAGSDVC